MNVAVVGLWHLGTVTAACVAAARHDVIAFDDRADTVAEIEQGRLPVSEPGLRELMARARLDGRLRLSSSPADLGGAEIVWIAYDTPVDEEGRGDVRSVMDSVAELFPHVREQSLVLISSQLPAGSTRKLEGIYRRARPGGTASFAYSPENLRLGRAIEAFTQPARVVAGIREETDKDRIARLFKPFTERIEWMSVESAEMTKHALNAFLATSIAFANELGAVCERVGADAREVERGLKTDARVGPRAYVRPGAAFAGGTLARDVAFLAGIGLTEGIPTHLLSAVRESNEAHKQWPRRRLEEIIGDVRDRIIAILGLTYKPDTDTLRGSSAVETARWLVGRGASVTAYDPAVKALPAELRDFIELRGSAEEALRGADAALVATEWPQFTSISADDVIRWMRHPLVLDVGRFLEARLGSHSRIRYVSVGRAA
ncbi:MAG TPA: nucleotide sugar dehydrogenase [Methylomirabilota bacterium]|nr:nucleotide sugar dehydrogenase [Methylomirabilota bacterium]